jgi:DNA-binding transcriptional LysR family regulator
MTTFRELEAFVAVADMGSFEKAARNLGTSQSGISRLIHEFEQGYAQPLFNRERRAARLTLKGQEVLVHARAILLQRMNLMERFGGADLLAPTLRLGVTELSAVTWLGSFIATLKARYPGLRLDLKVGASVGLHALMQDGQLDAAVVMESVRSHNMVRVPVGVARCGWYCAVNAPLPGSLKLAEFERQTVLLQGRTHGGGTQTENWLVERGVKLGNSIQSDSLAALAGICAAGLGVASLPRAVASHGMASGLLRELKIPIGAPSLQYVLLMHSGAMTQFHSTVADLARQTCDFNKAPSPRKAG